MEANIELMKTFLRQNLLHAMVWPRVNEGWGGHHQEDDNYTDAGKEKKRRPNKRWLDYIK